MGEAGDVAGFVDSGDETEFDYLSTAVPSVANTPGFRDWWDRAGNRGASPAMAAACLRVTLASDVREVLPAVTVPTLVAHRVDNVLAPIGFGRYLADHIPNARLVELPGADDLMWVGDAEGLVVRGRGIPDRRPAFSAGRSSAGNGAVH